MPKGLDYGSLIAGATKSNINNLPSLVELANLSTDEITAQLERALPGFKNLRDTGTGVIASELRGEIPLDVQRGIERRAAESGISMGTSGSQFSKFDAARNLGLTSLELTQRGLNSAQSWMQQAQGRTFDFSKMFISPEMAIDQGKFNWQRDWLANQVAAAPDPGKRGSLMQEAAAFGAVAGFFGGSGLQQPQQQQFGNGGSPGGGGYGGNGGYNSESFFGTGNNGYGAAEGGGDIGGIGGGYGGAGGSPANQGFDDGGFDFSAYV